ncbi:response regulator transcription factor [Azonexus sp.]|uniref:response regulator n=1 Tax=Azonexus sp. TaxID=1872668 RepID=UPI0027BA043D|nr:response regulator transcription factor [Azonexus sp.]
MSTRIMLVDDHRLLRETLAIPLTAEPGFSVVAQAGHGREALDLLRPAAPDLLLLDVGLPDMSGIEVAHQALTILPNLRIIALSGYADKIFVDEMLKAGAKGYVVKSAGTHELILAIHAVMAGHVFLSPEITAAMLDATPSGLPAASREAAPGILGKRERAVLCLLARGLRSEQIAEEMAIQPGTVDVHRRNIKRKLGLRTVAELTRYAIRHKLLPA